MQPQSSASSSVHSANLGRRSSSIVSAGSAPDGKHVRLHITVGFVLKTPSGKGSQHDLLITQPSKESLRVSHPFPQRSCSGYAAKYSWLTTFLALDYSADYNFENIFSGCHDEQTISLFHFWFHPSAPRAADAGNAQMS